MALHASWVHGNAAVIDIPSAAVVDRSGRGAGFMIAGAFTPRLHVPIPTPVIANGTRVSAKQFFLLFEANGVGCGIVNVEIHDGDTLIHRRDVSLTGNHLSISPANTFVLPQPRKVNFGINLSVEARAGGKFSYGRILVSSAGGDFLT